LFLGSLLFFVLFNILQGNLSLLAGWEVHNEVVTPYGSSPTLLMPAGSMLIDTGFPMGPGTMINITVENGSWVDETTTQPVFNQLTFQIDPSEPLRPIDENDAVWNLVTQTPFPNGGPPNSPLPQLRCHRSPTHDSTYGRVMGRT
jgi:hypothetical protein